MEIVGFKVDRIYIDKVRDRKIEKIADMDSDVKEFLKNQAFFLKMQAMQNYKKSENPVEKLEYKLNKLIGPKILKKKLQ